MKNLGAWSNDPPWLFFCASNHTIMDPEEKAMLADLIWLNAVIATELIQITENTSAILRKAPPPQSCLDDHRTLRNAALAIAERYHPGTGLKEHLVGHQ
ncbi:MAG: hypothetical protein A4E37_01535 [Methanoregulaceae archaeon PtaB.Bin056]|nr:MAG: hypothetical protein A4E37_01535 [Methanoregulaceae archaeon PtaB.Bin056]